MTQPPDGRLLRNDSGSTTSTSAQRVPNSLATPRQRGRDIGQRIVRFDDQRLHTTAGGLDAQGLPHRVGSDTKEPER